MKPKSKNLIKIMFTLFIVFFVFGTVNAQQPQVPEYLPLAPIPGVSNQASTTLDQYLPAVFNLSIGIAAVLAFAMITFGGIVYATSDAISNKSQGREYIKNAVIGLILVIGSYAIIYTINPNFLDFSLVLNRPNVASGLPTVTPGVPMTTSQLQDDQTIRNQLGSLGVQVNNPPCATGATQGCTNVNGLPTNAINGLGALSSACGGCVVITGGTEGGHATHGSGRPFVDLRPTGGLNSYLGVSNPVDGQVVNKSVGSYRISFTYETLGGNPGGTSTGNHWHVAIN